MTQPPYHPHQPFDPTRPLGPQRPEATRIDQFTPPRSPLPWLIMVGAVVIAALILLTATLQPITRAVGLAQPVGHRHRREAGADTPSSPRTGKVSGRWEVVESRWNDEGVEINLRMAVDEGTLWYTFMAFSNDDIEVLEPGPAMSSPALGWEPIDAGQERTGWIFFPTYRAELTLLLANDAGRQISALLIPS